MKNRQKIGVLAVLLTVASSEASSACKKPVVAPNAIKQVLSLIDQYDEEQTPEKKNCLEKQMYELLQDLKHQSKIFEGASEVEDMSGDMLVAPINKNEALQLERAAVMVEKKLSEIDKQKKITGRKELQKNNK